MGFKKRPRKPLPPEADAFVENAPYRTTAPSPPEPAAPEPSPPEPAALAPPPKKLKKPRPTAKAKKSTKPKKDTPAEDIMDTPKTPASFRVPQGLLERARDVAAATDWSVNALIVEGLRAMVESEAERYRERFGEDVPPRRVLRKA